MLLPFQEASLIVNVSVFRARMVLDQLEADSESSHGVKFIFLMPDGLHARQNFSGLFVVVVVVVYMISSLVSRPALNKAVTCVNLTFVTNKCPFSNSLLVQLHSYIVYLCTKFLSHTPSTVACTTKKEDCNQIIT